MKRILLILICCLAAPFALAAGVEVKVVYQFSDGEAQATQGLRNIKKVTFI